MRPNRRELTLAEAVEQREFYRKQLELTLNFLEALKLHSTAIDGFLKYIGRELQAWDYEVNNKFKETAPF
jgi:hypothetical protein